MLFLLAVLTWHYLPRTRGECCPTRPCGSKSICADCSLGTPYCGRGLCNIFGCNCESGCLADSKPDPNSPCYPCFANGKFWNDIDQDGESLIDYFTKNPEYYLTYWEFSQWLNATQPKLIGNLDYEFEHADWNRDGRITVDEVDYDLARKHYGD